MQRMKLRARSRESGWESICLEESSVGVTKPLPEMQKKVLYERYRHERSRSRDMIALSPRPDVFSDSAAAEIEVQ